MGTQVMGDTDESARKLALGSAKIAEQAERYEEMVEFMNQIIDMGFDGDELNQEERNLISVGYKNMMSVRRTSWRTCQSYEEKEIKENNTAVAGMYSQYKTMIMNEIDKVILKVMEEVVNKYTSGPQKAQKAENLVFFHKMEGDYYRYGAETSIGAKRETYKNQANNAYQKAQTAAQGSVDAGQPALPPTNPILLGLGLNQSVFFYEICEKNKEAKELAQKHFDEALDKLEQLEENEYKDATLIMQLLKDNLTLWSESDDPSNADDMQIEDVDN